MPRNKTLLKKWNFKCQCRLCTDCTENGSYYSALKCDICEAGHLLPQMSADIWQCDKCGGEASVRPNQAFGVLAEQKRLYNALLVRRSRYFFVSHKDSKIYRVLDKHFRYLLETHSLRIFDTRTRSSDKKMGSAEHYLLMIGFLKMQKIWSF